MIRPTLPDDTETLCTHAAATQVFYDYEIDVLREVLDDYHAGEDGQHALTIEVDGAVAGFAHFCETAMTDRTWELWWIVVDPAKHGKGLGKQLMAEVERTIRQHNGRLLLIETSSLPRYTPTRQFYLKLGYAEMAVVKDFYKDGDDKVIYWKKM